MANTVVMDDVSSVLKEEAQTLDMFTHGKSY
jgi:hypothetical protein